MLSETKQENYTQNAVFQNESAVSSKDISRVFNKSVLQNT